MNAKLPLLLLAINLWISGTMSAQDAAHDTTFSERNIPLDEVVVTGTRSETDVRHLSQTVSVLNRLQIGLSGGNARLMVLIDGHPQYAGIFGHPISDVYQTLLADKVEVLRGPASVLYGSNAMGGVINIVTRKMHEDGIKTNVRAGYGSYNTLETELTNRIRQAIRRLCQTGL